jgi:hypothetical protein
MFHKNALPAATSTSSAFPSPATPASIQMSSAPTRLMLVPSGDGSIPHKPSSAFADLVSISAHRCSSFFAEAAVLVLVLALLDRFMLKGHLEPRWVIVAVTLSLMLLAASIATDLSARRWLQRH